MTARHLPPGDCASGHEVIFGESRTWRLRIPAGNGQPETLLEFPPGTTREEAESVLEEAKRIFLEGLS